jgi:hypothetical protein
MQRRKDIGPPNYMEHFEEMRNRALKYAKEHHHEVYKKFAKEDGTFRGGEKILE